jgi:hypothetical protein
MKPTCARHGVLMFLAVLLAACLPASTPLPTPTPAPDFPSTQPPVARDAVVEYVRRQHPEVADLLVSPAWEALPEPAVHALAVYGYVSDAWQIDMTVLPAELVEIDGVLLQEDTFDIEFKVRSPPPYILWSGKYAPDAGVTEDLFVDRQATMEAIAPEAARDLAFRFLVDGHPEVDTPAQQWSEVEADESAWSSRYRYEAGDWRVAVLWYESTATYQVDGQYEYIGDQYVKIAWTVLVSADGKELQELSFDSFYG